MKLLDVSWEAVLQDIALWQNLPLPARRTVLTQLKTHGYASKDVLEPYLDIIQASGLTVANVKGNLVSVREDRRELMKVLRAMHRHPVFDDPSPQQLQHYLEQHFTSSELQSVGGAGTELRSMVDRHSLAPRIVSTRWVEELLGARTKNARSTWMGAHGLAELSLFTDNTAVISNLQTLVGELSKFTQGVALKELLASKQIADPSALATAIHAGLATLVIFAGMRGSDLEPMIGLWPKVSFELSRPPAVLPAPVQPADQFSFPVVMEDMTTLLAEVLANPVRMRSADLQIFARSRTEIEQRLVAIPEWAATLFQNSHLSRVDTAARSLMASGFAAVPDHYNNPHLEGTEAGARWLARTARERLGSIVDGIRSAKDVNPGRFYELSDETKFFPFTFPWQHPSRSLRLREALSKYFLTASVEFVSLDQFLDYAARTDNPLLAGTEAGADPHGLAGHRGGDPRELARGLWHNALVQFLTIRLLPCGGATIGRTASGTICFKLTDIGRYMLGAAKNFEYGSGPAGDVVVQPNFDVVFLGTAPSAEATIARFAERVGTPPGLAFRITRASVLAAAESGMEVGDVIGAIAQASTKPIPKNVEREIAGWMAAVRRARLRAAELIECADEDSASRIATVLGGKGRRLTPTVFELPVMAPAARAAMTKKLRAAGVFLDVAKIVAPAVVSRTRRRNGEDWEDDLD